jgi:hypothetical protein
VLSCVGSGLATGWSLVQGVLPIVYKCKITEPHKEEAKARYGLHRHVRRRREPTVPASCSGYLQIKFWNKSFNIGSLSVHENFQFLTIIFLEEIFLWSIASRPALGPTQPTIQWVPGGSFSGGKDGRGVKLTIHLGLVPRSRMMELYLHSPICLHGMVHN